MVIGDSGWLEKEHVGNGVYKYERYLRIIDTTRIGQVLRQAHVWSVMAGIKKARIRFGKDATEIIIEGVGMPK